MWSSYSVSAFAAYVAFLSLSRTALVASAHHLQSPTNAVELELIYTQIVPSLKVCLGHREVFWCALVGFAFSAVSLGLTLPQPHTLTQCRVLALRAEACLIFTAGALTLPPQTALALAFSWGLNSLRDFLSRTGLAHGGILLFLLLGLSPA